MEISVERVYNLGEYKSVRFGRKDILPDGTPEEVVSKYRNLQLLYVDLTYNIYMEQLNKQSNMTHEERYAFLIEEFEKTIAEIKALTEKRG